MIMKIEFNNLQHALLSISILILGLLFLYYVLISPALASRSNFNERHDNLELQLSKYKKAEQQLTQLENEIVRLNNNRPQKAFIFSFMLLPFCYYVRLFYLPYLSLPARDCTHFSASLQSGILSRTLRRSATSRFLRLRIVLCPLWVDSGHVCIRPIADVQILLTRQVI